MLFQGAGRRIRIQSAGLQKQILVSHKTFVMCHMLAGTPTRASLWIMLRIHSWNCSLLRYTSGNVMKYLVYKMCWELFSLFIGNTLTGACVPLLVTCIRNDVLWHHIRLVSCVMLCVLIPGHWACSIAFGEART